jgi:hypothetical protein
MGRGELPTRSARGMTWEVVTDMQEMTIRSGHYTALLATMGARGATKLRVCGKMRDGRRPRCRDCIRVGACRGASGRPDSLFPTAVVLPLGMCAVLTAPLVLDQRSGWRQAGTRVDANDGGLREQRVRSSHAES